MRRSSRSHVVSGGTLKRPRDCLLRQSAFIARISAGDINFQGQLNKQQEADSHDEHAANQTNDCNMVFTVFLCRWQQFIQ